MNRLRYTLLILIPLFGLANEKILTDHALLKSVGTIVRTNAQITQLSNQQQEIVSQIPGHIEAYFVQPGEEVREGDRVVMIRSMAFSQMSAEYLALGTQLEAAKAQLAATRKLYKKGLASQDTLNARIIAVQEIASKRNALASQLHSLGTDPEKITRTTDKMVLYAHASGVVGKLLVPLHSNIDAQTPLLSIVDQRSYYAVAYLGINDAIKVDTQTKGWVRIADKRLPARFVQLLPTVDTETQRAKVLFKVDKSPKVLLLDAFVEMDIALAPTRKVVMVKASALTLFKGEWVLFVPVDHQEEKEHNEESGDHDAHEEEEEGHEAHEHEALPYAPVVVKILTYAGDEVAIEGVEPGSEYVSKGTYFVKSMLLKSSLGEHGH